jgi:hypothetical protein
MPDVITKVTPNRVTFGKNGWNASEISGHACSNAVSLRQLLVAFQKQPIFRGELEMKYAIRIVALTFVAIAGLTGATPLKNTMVAANAPSFGPPGPIPACNPFIQNCPPIR